MTRSNFIGLIWTLLMTSALVSCSDGSELGAGQSAKLKKNSFNSNSGASNATGGTSGSVGNVVVGSSSGAQSAGSQPAGIQNNGPAYTGAQSVVQQQSNTDLITITGTAPKWSVRVDGEEQIIDGKNMLEQTVGPLDAFIQHSYNRIGGCQGSSWKPVQICAQGLDDAGKRFGADVCATNATVVFPTTLDDCGSPIVLDLGNRGFFGGISLVDSQISFDIFGTGEKLRTGWTQPATPFLARDLNGNGIIDNGRELFGEGTRLSNGQRAADGYVAMASLDTNRDGFLDARDAEFGSLLVWTDSNMDGVSQASEVEKLSAFGVTKLSVKAERSLRHIGRDTAGNDVRFESRFWGPAQCGTQGCLSFDVFFAIARTDLSHE